jgi:predicted KAP-like P-loop ATPase
VVTRPYASSPNRKTSASQNDREFPQKTRFSADRPNTPPSEDLLGRDAFAQRLAGDIRAWGGNDSLVIAIYGNWGCGKTSLKERVLWHLREEDPDYPILEFNPWQFSGDGDLSGPFLRELDSVLKSGKAGQSSADASKLLRTYTRRLSGFAGAAAKTVAPILVERSPFFSAAAKGLGEMLTKYSAWLESRERTIEHAEERTLPEIKDALTKAMAQLDRPILVAVDDIDRLNANEIPEIFRLVKINADFPKLIYLLLFDRPVICEALDKVSNERGKEYLEKIVQVAYHLPEAPVDKVREILFKGIDECVEGRAAGTRWEQERWSTLFLDGMSVYFCNLRHVYRFLGSFDFQVRHFERSGGFEVNPVDLLGLETLRVFEPNLYERLFRNKPLLTGNYGLGIFDDKKPEEIGAEVSNLVSVAADSTRAAARHIIQTIFPPAIGAKRGPATDEWLRQARVCHSDIFDKYFTLQLTSSDLGQVELEQIIAVAGDRDKLRTALKNIEERGLIRKTMDRFEAYKDQIPLASMPALITAFCDCADSFPERTPNFFDFDPLTHVWRIVYFGLQRDRDANSRFKILEHAIQKTSGIALPVRIVSGEERRKEPDERDHEYLINEDQVEELKKICVQKLRAAAKSGALKSTTHGAMLLWRWSEWDSIDAVRSWLTAECEKNGATPWLLSVLTSEGATNGKPFYYLTWSTLARFVDTDLIKARASELKEAALNQRERIGLQQFKRALKRKDEGKPELTGHEWRDDE